MVKQPLPKEVTNWVLVIRGLHMHSWSIENSSSMLEKVHAIKCTVLVVLMVR